MDDKKTEPMDEVTAMQKIATALSGLDDNSIARVLRWAADRFMKTTINISRGSDGINASGASQENGYAINSGKQYADLAELYHAASPASDIDRALVAAYWFQYAQGETDFVSQDVNSALKDLGHGIGNITDAFDALITRKPSLVMQVKKTGTTKQARKKYKLTVAGKTAVEQMLEQHQ